MNSYVQVFEDKIYDLLDKGLSKRQVARELSIPRSTLWDFLNSTSTEELPKVTAKAQPQGVVSIQTVKHLSKSDKGHTHIVIPDTQCKGGIDMDYLRWYGEYIALKMPDVIVHLGDHADMPSLSSYDKGKKAMEGQRVQKDIEASIKGMNLLLAPIKELQDSQKKMYGTVLYKPRMVLTLGNHECLTPDHEVLTTEGFVNITNVTKDHTVAQYSDEGVVWANPLSLISKEYTGSIYSWNSKSFSVSCTENHRMLYKTSTYKTEEAVAKEMNENFRIITALDNCCVGINKTDDEIRLGGWLCTDSHFSEYGSACIYQRESNAYKIENLLITLGIPFNKKIRDRDIKEICGKVLKDRCEKSVEFYLSNKDIEFIGVDSNKYLPSWAKDLNKDQWEVFLETLIDADGTIPTHANKSRVFYGQYKICSNLQEIAVTKGWSASLTEYRENQWRVNLVKRQVRKQEHAVPVVSAYSGMVHCLEMPLGNFVVRHNNKVHVTGNCRIMRHVDANPELDGFLSYDNLKYKEMGWEVYDYLEPVEIDGVTYIHYFPNPFTGKPYGGSALNILQKVGGSFTQGHKQTLDVATRTLHTGEQQWAIICGASYPHNESYKGYTGNKHWRGIIVKHTVKNGSYDPLFISMEYLRDRYAKGN